MGLGDDIIFLAKAEEVYKETHGQDVKATGARPRTMVAGRKQSPQVLGM